MTRAVGYTLSIALAAVAFQDNARAEYGPSVAPLRKVLDSRFCPAHPVLYKRLTYSANCGESGACRDDQACSRKWRACSDEIDVKNRTIYDYNEFIRKVCLKRGSPEWRSLPISPSPPAASAAPQPPPSHIESSQTPQPVNPPRAREPYIDPRLSREPYIQKCIANTPEAISTWSLGPECLDSIREDAGTSAHAELTTLCLRIKAHFVEYCRLSSINTAPSWRDFRTAHFDLIKSWQSLKQAARTEKREREEMRNRFHGSNQPLPDKIDRAPPPKTLEPPRPTYNIRADDRTQCPGRQLFLVRGKTSYNTNCPTNPKLFCEDSLHGQFVRDNGDNICVTN